MMVRMKLAAAVIAGTAVAGVASFSPSNEGAFQRDDATRAVLPAAETGRRPESAATIQAGPSNRPLLQEHPTHGDRLWWTREQIDGPRRKVVARKVPTESLVLPVDPQNGESLATGRIVVKFRDELGIRAPRSPVPYPVSMTGADTGAIEAILAINGATITQWINRTPEQLREVTDRAELYSGRPQIDLASIFFVDPPANRLVETAQALNDLDLTDWVSIGHQLAPHQQPPGSPQGCDPQNLVICNAPNPFGPTMATPFCTEAAQPPFIVPGVGNTADCNPDPGDQNQAAEYGCADAICCNLVASILPECSDSDSGRGWDLYCAALANIYCFGTIYDSNNPSLPLPRRYDPCFVDPNPQPPPPAPQIVQNPVFAAVIPLLQGSCLSPATTAGCNNAACCNAVCLIDPSCCSLSWDSACVLQAFNLPECGGVSISEPTPDFTATATLVDEPQANGVVAPVIRARGRQAYTLRQPVLGTNGDIGWGLQQPGAELLQLGFRGGGLDLDGMREFAILFANEYQGGGAPLLNGRTINVGVIDGAAFVNHEDFIYASPTNSDGTGGILLERPKVIAEPGQTIILLPQLEAVTKPDHGTAILGVIVAAENGFGITGIAHEAQGWFFPTYSIEEGGRSQNAIFSAIETFGPGDVINLSFGPNPQPFCGLGVVPTLASQPEFYTLLRLATDSGITPVISAGNSGAEVAAEAGEIRSGALVVGASWPGQQLFPANAGGPYCRFDFSNWFSGEEPLGVVDVHAWGGAVTTLGFGTLFRGETPQETPSLETGRLRTYTANFSQTSASAAMISGVVAVLQSWAQQVYGMPLSPEALGEVIRNYGSQQRCVPSRWRHLCPCRDHPSHR